MSRRILFSLCCTVVLICGGSCISAAVFTVTNTNSSGAGSLRQAILDNNHAQGSNVIEIDLTGTGPFVIKPTGQFLPPLKGPVVLRVKSATESQSSVAAAASPAGGRGGRGGAAPVHPPVSELSPSVILDGSALIRPRVLTDCPGATFHWNAQTSEWEKSDERGSGPNVRGYYGPGLSVQDSHDVEISGLEIRDFCAGIATVRSSNVSIHDVKIVDNQGAAGVIFTGDDEKSGVTDLSFGNQLVNSLLLDNGDGFEFTRGTHDSLLQGNFIGLTQSLPENGNAVEFATAGDHNAVMGNTFTKYVDTAVTVSGSHHIIRDNKFLANVNDGLRVNGAGVLIEGNTFRDNGGSAMTVGGLESKVIDNVIMGNAGAGVVVSNATVTISRNTIVDNGHLGIDFAKPAAGRGGGGRGGASAPAISEIPRSPTLLETSTWNSKGLTLNGSVAGKPNQSYSVEVFVSPSTDRHSGDEQGWGEGAKYLGTAHAVADGTGSATFRLTLRISDPVGNGAKTGYFTATVTDDAGSTSKFSRELTLTQGQ